MYICLVVLQSITILMIAPIVYYVWLHQKGREHVFLLACSASIEVTAIGYLIEMTANTMDIAMLGTKVSYFGKVYISMTMFLYICELCKVKIPEIVIGLFTALNFFISFLVFTNESHNLFYTSAEFIGSGLFPHMKYGHGVFYFIYMGEVIVLQLVSTAIAIARYRKTTLSLDKKKLVIVYALSAAVTICLAWFFTGKTGGYDTTAIGYLICAIFFFVSLYKFDVMGTVSIIKEQLIDSVEGGVIAVGSDGEEIIFTNEMAQNVFPELALSGKIHKISSLNPSPRDSQTLFINQSVYGVSKKEIYEGSKHKGTMYFLTDNTGTYYYTELLQNEVANQVENVKNMQSSIILSLADVIEARDGFTGSHIKNTRYYATLIVQGIMKRDLFPDKMTPEYAAMISEAAPLHDIGKIKVPDSILGKPGRLDKTEFEIIKKHSAEGAAIIKQTLSDVESEEYLSVAYEIALYHHEKWDGSGYPFGLSGEDIPLCARIMAVADVYDALCSERSYKKSLPEEEARQIIIEGKGSHFDPVLVDVFIEELSASSL